MAPIPGKSCSTPLRNFGQWTVEIVKRSAHAVGFEPLPRRWVVERTLAWLNRTRRPAKDFEASIASAKAWLIIASVQLLDEESGILRTQPFRFVVRHSPRKKATQWKLPTQEHQYSLNAGISPR